MWLDNNYSCLEYLRIFLCNIKRERERERVCVCTCTSACVPKCYRNGLHVRETKIVIHLIMIIQR